MINKNGKFYESDYEIAVIELLQQAGWNNYSCGCDMHRQFTDTIYEEDLRTYLKAKYKDKQLDESDYNSIIGEIRNVSGPTDLTESMNAYTTYRDGIDYTFFDSSKEAFKVEYIDFEHPENNIFRVVNQMSVKYGPNEMDKRIPDVLLFINGIPVCIFELKNPTDENATIRDAHTQITVRYRRDIHQLTKYCVLACISDGSNSRLGTVFTPYEYFYAWKKVNNEDAVTSGVDELVSLINGALSPVRILEILRDYVYFPDPSENNEKDTEIICRYPQFFATRKLRDHILLHLIGKGGDGKGGTYFGATGCGKTYTMMFLARQLALRHKTYVESPTILIIVDREDLETQAAKLFCKSKKYLADEAVKVFEDREDLKTEMTTRKTGGVYITTIQKFEEKMGLLSDRSNIICMSDEAHRSQTNIGKQLKIKTDKDKEGAFITYGFAQYLRNALPNATYVAFTGTPIDETVYVFGDIVDSYTMKQSQEDGITVPISYVPRLARVAFDEEEAKKIEDYYKKCEEQGAEAEDVDASKRAMSSLEEIIGNKDRLERVANDIISDYELRCANSPHRLQKAMITCCSRTVAYDLYSIIKVKRPEWCVPKKAMDESIFTEKDLQELHEVGFIEMVATRGKDDKKEMFDYLGDKEHRKFLDKEFKDDKSNMHIAIVVDMWITGFDCPSLTFLYNDKPLQKHTLIQTISRVNRKYEDKEVGVIIDYIGIRENMKKAMKRYGGGEPTSAEDVDKAYTAFVAELQILKEMFPEIKFDDFFGDNPLKRLMFLQQVGEFILANTVEEKGKVSFKTLFKGHVRRMKASYNIAQPAGKLTSDEEAWAQCFMGILSFVQKMSGTTHDIESMNKVVQTMVQQALSCSSVESILDIQDEEDIFGIDFSRELGDVKMPNTKFQILVNLLQKAIREYGKTNKVRAKHFEELLDEIITQYNTRDKLTFCNDVASETIHSVTDLVNDKVNELSDKLIKIFSELKVDKQEFKKLGISFEEKAFMDILTDIRDRNKFEYDTEKCKNLAKKIKELVDNSAIYADWLNNDNLRSDLACELSKLLYKEKYPPEWDDEVFERVMEQVENYKTYQSAE